MLANSKTFHRTDTGQILTPPNVFTDEYVHSPSLETLAGQHFFDVTRSCDCQGPLLHFAQSEPRVDSSIWQ